MNLDFSEEQQMLRDTVNGVCSEYASVETVRAMEDDPDGYTPEFWKQLGDLGIAGLTVPEQYGGSGLSAIEGAIVYEEFGRWLAPSPHFVSSVLAASVLLSAADEEQKQEWLPRISSGEAIFTTAWLEPGHGYGPEGVQVTARVAGDEYLLSGEKLHVAFANSAARFVVLARSGEGTEGLDLFIVDPASPGIAMTQQLSLASDCQYQVSFDNVKVPASARIGESGSGWRTWNEAMHAGIIMLAAQAMGGAERAMAITVQYAKDREQFGKPLGAFQALAHYLADGQTTVDGGKTLVYQAAWAHAEGNSIERLAPMTKLFTCQTFRDVTAMCVQVHGGMGFTIEYDIQLYFRRAKQLQLSWWDSRYLEELIACAVLDRN